MKRILIFLSVTALLLITNTKVIATDTFQQEKQGNQLTGEFQRDGIEFSYNVKEDGIYISGILSNNINVEPPKMINDIPVIGIDNGAFYNNNIIEKVVLSENIKTIGSNAFRGSSSLTAVVLSEGLSDIGDNAFSECTALSDITIPSSVKNIGFNAFDRSAKLRRINVHPDNKIFSSTDGVLFDKSGAILIKYPPGRQNSYYKIPASVIIISPYAFNCSYLLEGISIPEKLEIVGELAFESCSSLRELTFYENLKGVGRNAFLGCAGLTKLTFFSDPIGLNSEFYSDIAPLVEGPADSGAETFAENNGFDFTPYEKDEEILLDDDKPEFITKTLPTALRYFPYYGKIEISKEGGEIYLKDGSELPRGLYLSDGVIMGRAEGWGVYRFTLFANFKGMETEQTFTLNINKEPTIDVNVYPVKKKFPSRIYINSMDKNEITVLSTDDYIVSVYIDNDKLSKDDYEYFNETVTIKNDVLNNLSEGNHLLVLEYTKGGVAAPFQIKKPSLALEETEEVIIGKSDNSTFIVLNDENSNFYFNSENDVSENPNTGNIDYSNILLPFSVILILLNRKAKNK